MIKIITMIKIIIYRKQENYSLASSMSTPLLDRLFAYIFAVCIYNNLYI